MDPAGLSRTNCWPPRPPVRWSLPGRGPDPELTALTRPLGLLLHGIGPGPAIRPGETVLHLWAGPPSGDDAFQAGPTLSGRAPGGWSPQPEPGGPACWPWSGARTGPGGTPLGLTWRQRTGALPGGGAKVVIEVLWGGPDRRGGQAVDLRPGPGGRILLFGVPHPEPCWKDKPLRIYSEELPSWASFVQPDPHSGGGLIAFGPASGLKR